jgi:aldose 1-epimerase
MHTLRNENGMRLTAIGRGATITELWVPDRDGVAGDIVLGFADEDGYRSNPYYFGAVVGRCANRIAGGAFSLDGVDYALATNNPPNHLHGGERGFDAHDWEATLVDDPRGESVRFTRESPAGEEGYPGALRASVAYTVTDADELVCEMEATCDAPTLCNLAQHAYWNLAGHDAGSIGSHELTLFAERYTPVDETMIPTGELASVAGTPLDFRKPRSMGAELARVGDDPTGYDHNFAVDGDPTALRPVARVFEPTTGRVMSLCADQPGVQFYTGNFLDGRADGKAGARYPRHAGFCLETQRFPDAIHRPGWVQPVLRPGEVYRHTMVFAFSTDRG